MPTNPCDPIGDLTPPLATLAVQVCCAKARADYLSCLIAADGGQPECAACESTYRAAIEQCTSFPSAPSGGGCGCGGAN